MKTTSLGAALALAAIHPAAAQPNDRRPPPVPPIIAFFDADRDGVLSESEIGNAAKALGRLDHDHDGRITAEEARPPAPPRDNRPPPPPVIAALDVDRNGTISSGEMENAPESLKTLDKNGDGELSPEELHPTGPPPPPEDSGGPQSPPPGGEEGDGPLDAE